MRDFEGLAVPTLAASLAGCLPWPGPLGQSGGRPAALRIDGVPRPAHAVGLCDPWRRSGRTRREEATRKVVCGRTRAGLGAKDPKQFDPKQLEPEWQRRRARGRAGEAQKNLQEKRDIPPTHPRYTPDTYIPDAPPMHPRRARGLIVRAAGAAAIGMAIAQKVTAIAKWLWYGKMVFGMATMAFAMTIFF